MVLEFLAERSVLPGAIAAAAPWRLPGRLTQPHFRSPEPASAFQQTTGDSDALRSLRNTDLIKDSVDFGLCKWPKEKTNIFYLCVSWGTRWMLARSWFARMTPALTGTGLLCSDARKSPEWGHGQGRAEAEWKSACGPTALKGDINLHTASVCLYTLCWQLRGLQVPTSGRAESQ